LLGSITSLLLTALLAVLFTNLTHLTGLSSEEAIYLQLGNAHVSLQGLVLDVGRDHVSATVNTLVLAYVGASLPILLLFSAADLGIGDALNLEVVAKE